VEKERKSCMRVGESEMLTEEEEERESTPRS
jgi:hypothetical protein